MKNQQAEMEIKLTCLHCNHEFPIGTAKFLAKGTPIELEELIAADNDGSPIIIVDSCQFCEKGKDSGQDDKD